MRTEALTLAFSGEGEKKYQSVQRTIHEEDLYSSETSFHKVVIVSQLLVYIADLEVFLHNYSNVTGVNFHCFASLVSVEQAEK